MNDFIKALWSYWNEPTPQLRLEKVEDKNKGVSNAEAFLFCIKFVVLAIAIFLICSILWMVQL